MDVKVDEEGFPDVVCDSKEMGPGSSKDNKCIVRGDKLERANVRIFVPTEKEGQKKAKSLGEKRKPCEEGGTHHSFRLRQYIYWLDDSRLKQC